MTQSGTRPDRLIRVAVVSAMATATISCGGGASAAKQPPTTTLRVGVSLGIISLANQNNGIRQIAQNITNEGLGRAAEDGRMEPQLADRWSLQDSGRELVVTLKPNVRFQDGSPADAPALAALLPGAIRNFAGSIADDIEAVRANDATTLVIRYRRPEPLLTDALEIMIRKNGGGAPTGPFMASPESATELVSNPTYRLGQPAIKRVDIKTYPSVRSAWAELLRDNIDMLYEVGSDALDSLENSTKISVFAFTRRYQYVVVLNSASPALRSQAVRRALNLSINRAQMVQQALNGHGVPSSGPIWPKHWTLAGSSPRQDFDPGQAAALINGQRVQFTCLMMSDPIYERIGLELKRQLAGVGVDVDLKSMSPDEMYRAQQNRQYDAVLTELMSGPTFLRLYLVWHSSGVVNNAGRGNPAIDAALDRVRNAQTDEEYQRAAPGVQAAFNDDPAAIFLAWSERARAVSRRFAVPAPEPGADVLRTLRLWTPRNDDRLASRN